MGFKTEPKYKLVKENYAGTMLESKDELELTPGEMLDLTYGLIPQKMFEVIIKWLKEEVK